MMTVYPFLGTLPQWISAVAAGAGVVIALMASQSWKNTLKQKRGDDLLTAMLDLEGQIGATRAAAEDGSPESYGSAVDRLFASSRTLLKAFVVAERSYNLDEGKLVEVRTFVTRTVENVTTSGGLSQREAAKAFYHNLQGAAARLSVYVRSIVK